MKLVVTGGSGFIGSALLPRLVADGHAVVLLSRSPGVVRPGVRVLLWDGKTAGEWGKHLEGADAVLNFAGESIGGKRWTRLQKQRILQSRVDATRAICAAIGKTAKKPTVLVNASAVGFYGPVEEGEVPESRERGKTFLSEVVDQWEEAAREAGKSGVRVVLLRTGVVLGKGGGALQRMVLPFRLFAGGPVGSGRQWFPWIHIDDLASIILLAMKDTSLSGPVNAVSPQAVTMREFSAELGKVLHRPSWIPVPGFVLKVVLGEMSSMLLTGQRVVPRVLERKGFHFEFPMLGPALADILK